MTPQVLESDTVTANCCPAFDFDMLLWGWGSDPDPSFILSILKSDEIPTGMNETCYSNPEYDRLFVEQAVEMDDAKRIEMVHEMQQLMLEDLPYIIPYYHMEVQAFRNDRFTNWPRSGRRLQQHPLPAGPGLPDGRLNRCSRVP